jgi:hypothetical protein
MSFAEVHRQLWRQDRIVTYKSLTSSKTHKVRCTLKGNFIQRTSDKIILWDLDNKKTIDIEVNTITNIN